MLRIGVELMFCSRELVSLFQEESGWIKLIDLADCSYSFTVEVVIGLDWV